MPLSIPIVIKHIEVKWIVYFLLPLFLLLPFNNVALASINYHQTRYTIADGLSHNTVMSITQDNFGKMWIGTFNGLNSYDGINFKNYFVSGINRPKELKNDMVISNLLVEKNSLWIILKLL